MKDFSGLEARCNSALRHLPHPVRLCRCIGVQRLPAGLLGACGAADVERHVCSPSLVALFTLPSFPLNLAHPFTCPLPPRGLAASRHRLALPLLPDPFSFEYPPPTPFTFTPRLHPSSFSSPVPPAITCVHYRPCSSSNPTRILRSHRVRRRLQRLPATPHDADNPFIGNVATPSCCMASLSAVFMQSKCAPAGRRRVGASMQRLRCCRSAAWSGGGGGASVIGSHCVAHGLSLYAK
ncbi:hypothetical protein C8R45DRAFT_1138395 [Mycena sanguinolenta]|nr:hypothetical protein C8R45DRAFT_1138395 [Mycena sanguinolenta]